MTPLEARLLWNKKQTCYKRGLVFCILTAALCIVGLCIGIVALRLSSQLLDIIAKALAFIVLCPFGIFLILIFRFFAINKKITMFCDHCGKYIFWGDPWICGFCDKENYNQTILYKCKYCDQSPHSFVCPHCEKLVHLDDLNNNNNEHPARMVNMKPSPKISPDEVHAREVIELQRKKELTRLNAELVKEEAALKAVRQTNNNLTEKPCGEQLEESFSKFRDRNLAVAMIAKRELLNAENKYRDDSDMLEKYRMTVLDWQETNMQ